MPNKASEKFYDVKQQKKKYKINIKHVSPYSSSIDLRKTKIDKDERKAKQNKRMV